MINFIEHLHEYKFVNLFIGLKIGSQSMYVIQEIIKNLSMSDVAFITSIFVLLFSIHLLIRNFLKYLRNKKIFIITTLISLYCLFYEIGTIRQEYMKYINIILPFDTKLQMAIDIMGFVLLFTYLLSISKCLKYK